jgi:hypothetical protein
MIQFAKHGGCLCGAALCLRRLFLRRFNSAEEVIENDVVSELQKAAQKIGTFEANARTPREIIKTKRSRCKFANIDARVFRLWLVFFPFQVELRLDADGMERVVGLFQR